MSSPSYDPAIDNIPVATVPTPNPDALMFRVEETLIPKGTFEYNSVGEASGSPLAKAIFAVEGVNLVLIAPRFITVGKLSQRGWPEVVPEVKRALREFIHSGDMAVVDETDAADLPDRSKLADVELKIIKLLDDEIRPALAMDGGDISFMGFSDGIVKLRLTGACGSCPSSTMTLKMGVEMLLTEEIEEVRGIEQVY